ncbi:MAG: GNAT family N-acetyltransferase [Leptonema sp. (in: Bacteria)]|nr:GNAT family N-acetyltransferase [Leptonema sp. (in: bacteria)]
MSFPDVNCKILVQNYDTNQKYWLIPSPQVYFSNSFISEFVQICNSADILNMIRCAGVSVTGRYKKRHATSFLNYAAEGWEDQDHFVFFLFTSDSKLKLSGCFELRNPKNQEYEVGYWIAPKYRGIGTFSLQSLLSQCKAWGIKGVYAKVLETNLASTRMLAKLKFRKTDQSTQLPNYGTLLTYRRSL